MKVAVYAICKNEWKFLDRWLERCGEADAVCVLDTGSTDGTWEALQARKKVMKHLIAEQKVFKPWRFDVARNESLQLIPEDIDLCFCLDLDELPEEGWRKKLEDGWDESANCGRYDYIWNFQSDGSEGVKFLGEKLHKRGCVRWRSPVHEWPEFLEDRKDCRLALRVEHHADETKSRGQYLGLLELAVQEDPESDRNLHYLGREYMFHGKWEKAIETLKRHLLNQKATWKPERSNSMRFIGRCYGALGDESREEGWLIRARAETPWRREPLADLAWLYYRWEDWQCCRNACEAALAIEERDLDYTSEPESWGSLPWDLLSIARWKLGDKEGAREAARKALELSPGDERIRRNVELMEN